MSIHQPSVMHFGDGRLISPDGCETIPADLWPELELLILLDPEPSELRAWERRLEDDLGVTERHRDAFAAPWYILRAATRQEKRASQSLTELGIEHYLPVETVLRKINREERRHDRALFPGYIFARIADADFHAAVEADGVHAPVRTYTASGERVPRRIPAALVAEIREAQARGDFDRTIVPPTQPLGVGDTVHVTTGPFAERVGAIIELRARDRLAVLLGSVIVEVGAAEIEAVT